VNVERIVSGRKWVEGPVWNRKKGYLLFSDIPANSVIKWQERKRHQRLFDAERL
jgi:gluconolactonase